VALGCILQPPHLPPYDLNYGSISEGSADGVQLMGSGNVSFAAERRERMSHEHAGIVIQTTLLAAQQAKALPHTERWATYRTRSIPSGCAKPMRWTCSPLRIRLLAQCRRACIVNRAWARWHAADRSEPARGAKRGRLSVLLRGEQLSSHALWKVINSARSASAAESYFEVFVHEELVAAVPGLRTKCCPC
jgi:hypothetical protein